MKMLKKIYLYRDSTLPIDGWLQACIICQTITSNLHHYKTIEIDKTIYEYQAHLCPPCCRRIQDPSKSDIFDSICDSYIASNITYPLNQSPHSHESSNQVDQQNQRIQRKFPQDLVHIVETIWLPSSPQNHPSLYDLPSQSASPYSLNL